MAWAHEGGCQDPAACGLVARWSQKDYQTYHATAPEGIGPGPVRRHAVQVRAGRPDGTAACGDVNIQG